MREPGTGSWLSTTGSAAGSTGWRLPQSNVFSCATLRSLTSLPTYGNARSPTATGVVSRHTTGLTRRSWVTTG
jgi:hypothetical protein